jgi:hypothetical protein
MDALKRNKRVKKGKTRIECFGAGGDARRGGARAHNK